MKLQTFLRTVLMLLLGFQLAWAQDKKDTYFETIKWLRQMKDSEPNNELRKLFEQADIRLPDLVRALDASPKEISINAQQIILYLAQAEGLRALEEWRRKPIPSGQERWSPKMELLRESKLLAGNDTDLVKLVMKNKHLFQAGAFNGGEITAKIIAENKAEKAALVEIIEGKILTSGWHIVIKQKEDRWYLISNNNIWVT